MTTEGNEMNDQKEFLTNLEIQVNEPLMKHFKQILRF